MAQNRAAPSLQTPGVRPISFLLDDSVSGLGSTEALTLYVRPEDLTRSDPSRVSITQTLGGAWGDSFGPGVPTISISGHTGWRRSQDGQDGEHRFLDLRDRVFDQWHQRRAAAIKAGRDPSSVQLIYSDALDNMAVVVAPMNFVLRRSRSRPLLFQYQIQMAVLADGVGDLSATLLKPGSIAASIAQSLGLDSLFASIDKITGYINQAKSFIDNNFVGPIQAFMNVTATLYNKVYSAIKSVDGVASSLISAARLSAQAGANIFHTFAAVANLPAHVRGLLMDIATAYTNIFCVLSNALRSRVVYEDYSDLYGASNCSSTSGGRPLSPLAGVNAFTVTNPIPTAPLVSVSPQAQSSMNTLASSDVALAPLPLNVVATNAGAIASGMVLS